jgi:hypothetical protein
MPIRHYLLGQGVAFEMALVTLQHADGPVAPTRDAVAQKIIELAKAGERDPERLCDGDDVNQRPPVSPPPPPGKTAGAAGFLNLSQSGDRRER